jgi:hypothetical protein
MITFKELSEAHKVGDKVTIVKGPKDVKGKEGRIGEIRKQAYKGAPKTYTVDYDHHETTGERKSVQLPAKHIKGVKEEVENLQEKHRVAITLSDPNHPAVTKRKELIQKTVRVKADNPGHAVDSAIHHFRKAGYKVHDHNYIGTVKEDTQLDELSTDKLAAYKTKAHADAKAADASGNYAKGDKRFKGINKATNKQFDNDLKKHGQYQKEDLDESAPFKKLDHAVAYATDKVKTHRDNLDGIEVYKHKSGGYDVNHTMNANGRNSLHKSGAKHLGTVYKDKPANIKEDLEEGTFKYHMDKAVAANDRGDVNRKKFHLSNAKQARYALKSTDIPKHKDLLDKYKSMTEGTNLEEGRGSADKHYSIAQDHKDKADKASDKQTRHAHLADYHDSMAHYHDQLGQHSLAQSHSDKAEINHEKSLQKNEAIQEGRDYDDNRRGFGRREREDDEYHVPDPEVKKNKTKKEDVAANNVGGGNIAGTQGDAGKKAVMTKKPMKRNIIQFKEYAIDAKGHKSSTGGLTQKGVDAYNRKTGGNLQTAVTTPPSKLDPDSKAAKRRKSFCARMGGMPGPMKDEKGRPTRKALALRKWNC